MLDRPVGGLVGYNRRPAHGRGCFANLGSGTLVPRGMDWRPRGGLVDSGSAVTALSGGGSATTHGQKAARC